MERDGLPMVGWRVSLPGPGIVTLNRPQLHQLAEDRVLDAKALLDAGRWSGAYYLAGYAIECGLKACVLAYVNGVLPWIKTHW